MNNVRRTAIAKIIEDIHGVAAEIRSIYIDEEMCFDAMPPGTLNSMNSEEAIDHMDAALESLADASESLTEILSC